MAMQRRSTSAVIGRIVTVIAILALLNATARLFHMWGFMRKVYTIECIEVSGLWECRKVPVSFWDMSLDTLEDGLSGFYVIHLFAALVLGLATSLFYGLASLIFWLLEDPEFEDELVCRDKDCGCIEHRDGVFYEDEQQWDYSSA